MADYIEPTKTAFNDAEQTAIDVLTSASPTLLTKTGSVIRELIIRPAAYLLSWLRGNITNDLKQYSVAYLKTSQLTENPVADAVASNYFVTRKQGTGSRGIITMTLRSPVLRLAAGSRFTVGSEQCTTTVQYMITNVPGTDTDTLVYLKSIPYTVNGTQYYVANVPVVDVNPGKVELPVGTPVTVNFGCTTLESADLTSPLTGGTDTETDAQLMKRAEYNTAEAGIGTYYGIKKKLAKAPVAVAGMAVIAGEDKPLFRARFNNVNINPGGYVDCHIKTSNQAITGEYDMEAVLLDEQTPTYGNAYYTVNGNTYTVVCLVPSTACPGFIRLDSIIAGGKQIQNYSVTYGSSDVGLSADGARLSNSQVASVEFTVESPALTDAKIEIRLSMTYVAGIDAVQAYLDKDTEHFIGQDIKVKSAVPVNVSIDCTVASENELTEDDLTGIKQAIVDYINTTDVGAGKLNFSDIRAAVLVSFPNIDLRLPCTMSASIYTTDGWIDSFYSTTGILDITHTAYSNYWSYQMCFFSVVLDNVRLNVL